MLCMPLSLMALCKAPIADCRELVYVSEAVASERPATCL